MKNLEMNCFRCEVPMEERKHPYHWTRKVKNGKYKAKLYGVRYHTAQICPICGFGYQHQGESDTKEPEKDYAERLKQIRGER